MKKLRSLLPVILLMSFGGCTSDGDTEVQEDMKQQSMNNNLLVAKLFTEINVADVDWTNPQNMDGKEFYPVTFQETFTNHPDISTYYQFKALQNTYNVAGASNINGFVCNGVRYRLPTFGELLLLVPPIVYWNGAEVSSSYREEIHLKNDEDGKYPASEDYDIKTSEDNSGLKRISDNVVYGLRFNGSEHRAAYRWEYAGEDNDRYLVIRIKAVDKNDTETSLDMIADEEYWIKNYLEYTFPASGFFSENNTTVKKKGEHGCCWSSTVGGTLNAYHLAFQGRPAGVGLGNNSISGFRPLRLVVE